MIHYIGSMDIFQLGQFDIEQKMIKTELTYGVRLHECYPQTISSLIMLMLNDKAVDIPITMNFRRWSNLTLDQVNNAATVGSSFGDVPTIKASKEFGLFSGVLSKLPPELREQAETY